MQVKLSTFNKELIRVYMESSSILEQGIIYVQYVNYTGNLKRETPREVAKETAILQAMDFCYRKWYNDSTGYISDERVAFREFEKDVKEHRYFYTRGMKSLEQIKEEKLAEEKREKENEEKLWEDEYERVRKLRNFCKENNLNFEEENRKAIKKFKIKSKIFTIEIIATIIVLAVLVIPCLKYVYEFLFNDTLKGLIGLGVILGICVVIFVILCLTAPHSLPKDFYKQIESGKYKFDQE